MAKIKPILGTMTFGPQVDVDDSRAMVKNFFEAGYREIDTAYVYNEGESERILGSLFQDMSLEGMSIATKVNPRITGKLDAEAVQLQFPESLRRLGLDSVDILYLHFPDPNTPVDNALEACADFHRKGKFRELGLSNFPASMVMEICRLCKDRGWPKPTVYQGMYNALSRKVEKELFPVLRKLGMRFYAFNPLAGGLLSGNYSDFGDNPESGRFALRPNYRKRYWKKSYFNALNILTKKCYDEKIKLPEAAFRWIIFHSCLDPSVGDGVILGASKLKQLEQNLNAFELGPLPEALVNAFSAAWKETEVDCPQYYRFVPAKKDTP